MTNIENDRDEMFRRHISEHTAWQSEQMALQTKLLERIDQSARVVKVLAIVVLVLLALAFIGTVVNAATP